MKIYLVMASGKEQEATLTRAGCKHRLLSFYELQKAGIREDYLKDMKRTGIGSYVEGDTTKKKCEKLTLKDFLNLKLHK